MLTPPTLSAPWYAIKIGNSNIQYYWVSCGLRKEGVGLEQKYRDMAQRLSDMYTDEDSTEEFTGLALSELPDKLLDAMREIKKIIPLSGDLTQGNVDRAIYLIDNEISPGIESI